MSSPAYKKKQRLGYLSQGLCAACGRNPVDPQLTTCGICRAYHRNRHQQESKRVKGIILNRYGTTCCCCGESIVKFLTLDHIDGGGKIHRKLLKVAGGFHFYRHLIDTGLPEGYRTMCFNCNSGRQLNDGICPHKEGQ